VAPLLPLLLLSVRLPQGSNQQDLSGCMLSPEWVLSLHSMMSLRKVQWLRAVLFPQLMLAAQPLSRGACEPLEGPAAA
jgi:hypothetical protein